ncbi:hypothetical protein F511_14981 [Dorcoceras hygrometricum]|uniref:Uncharacterized protein n=1 Tax=Dorcoceras hygrometricum TaxID=472368 RepID=A0A2Z7BGC7_9LAMI|nr:hypothetical protein F511_14981 [Dorcoceras hygrometricum]
MSNIGPKTSRAARDRPELNPRRNSAVRTPPELRRTAAAANEFCTRHKAARRRDRRASSRTLCPTAIGQPPTSATICAQVLAFGRLLVAQHIAHNSTLRPCNMRGPSRDIRDLRVHQRATTRDHRPAMCDNRTRSSSHESAAVRNECAGHRAGVLMITLLATRAWLRPVSRGNRHFTVCGGRLRQSGQRPEARLLRQPALEGLTRSAQTDSPRQVGWNNFRRGATAAARETRRRRRRLKRGGAAATRALRVRYGPFNPYIPIRSMTIGKSRVAIDPIAMHTSWRSNSDIASVTSSNAYVDSAENTKNFKTVMFCEASTGCYLLAASSCSEVQYAVVWISRGDVILFSAKKSAAVAGICCVIEKSSRVLVNQLLTDRMTVGLLSLSRFVSYPSLRQQRSWKRIEETSPSFSLLASYPSLLGHCFVSRCIAVVSYQDARASGNTALSSPCWVLLATMRRVVNYHSSWARQRQVELFDASGIWGIQVLQLVVVLTQLAMPQEVPVVGV